MNHPPHPFPLPIRWGEGGRRSGEGWFMVRMRDCEVVEATHEPSSPPVQPFVAYATKGCCRRFLASMRDFEIVGATHEPQKVAQASCLFGADRLEACPTLQPAARFMAATHVRFLEVFPFHEPGGARLRRALIPIPPSSPDSYPLEVRARRSLAPPSTVP